jgi:hypothetical protein
VSDLYERLLTEARKAYEVWAPPNAAPALGRLRLAVLAALETHNPHDGRCTECVEWCDCLDGVETSDVIDAGLAAQQCPHGNVPEPCGTVRAIARALDVPIGEIHSEA